MKLEGAVDGLSVVRLNPLQEVGVMKLTQKLNIIDLAS